MKISADGEIKSIVEALRHIKEPCQVTIFSNSTAVVKGISDRVEQKQQEEPTGKSNKSKGGEPLWDELLRLCEEQLVRAELVEGQDMNEKMEHDTGLALLLGYEEASKFLRSTQNWNRLFRRMICWRQKCTLLGAPLGRRQEHGWWPPAGRDSRPSGWASTERRGHVQTER